MKSKNIIMIDPQEEYGIEIKPLNKSAAWFNFFLDEIRTTTNIFFKEWALHNLYQDNFCGNCYCLIRYEGKIYLSYFWEEISVDKAGRTMPIGSPHEFPITLENYAKIYDEWLIILRDRHLLEHIVIKEEDDGSISFGRIYKNQSEESKK